LWGIESVLTWITVIVDFRGKKERRKEGKSWLGGFEEGMGWDLIFIVL
jgi:hypothetical protein